MSFIILMNSKYFSCPLPSTSYFSTILSDASSSISHPISFRPFMSWSAETERPPSASLWKVVRSFLLSSSRDCLKRRRMADSSGVILEAATSEATS